MSINENDPFASMFCAQNLEASSQRPQHSVRPTYPTGLKFFLIWFPAFEAFRTWGKLRKNFLFDLEIEVCSVLLCLHFNCFQAIGYT